VQNNNSHDAPQPYSNQNIFRYLLKSVRLTDTEIMLFMVALWCSGYRTLDLRLLVAGSTPAKTLARLFLRWVSGDWNGVVGISNFNNRRGPETANFDAVQDSTAGCPIPVSLLKDCTLRRPLPCRLSNLSLQTRRFPKRFKSAQVPLLPVLKKAGLETRRRRPATDRYQTYGRSPRCSRDSC